MASSHNSALKTNLLLTENLETLDHAPGDVKRFMKEQSKGKALPPGLPVTQAEIDADKVLTLIGKAIKPGEEELKHNVRSRSAVLRVAEKR